MSGNMFDIHFRGVEDLLRVAESRQLLLDANVRAAVARTVLWGASKIAEDCPVDTGRLRSSILGYLAQQHGVSLQGSDPQAITQGLGESVTEAAGYRGRIGTNVFYAALVDLGISGPKNRPKLTTKQLRYLFARGILQRGPGKTVIYTYRRRGTRGRGFFRNNLPLIDNYFQQQMHEAIKHAERGELLPVTF